MSAVDRTREILDRWARPASPGLSIAVLKGREAVFRGWTGLAGLEHGVAIGEATRFRIGSVSKHFAVAVTLLLAREGRIDIDAPARSYLPELPRYEVEPTVRQLMNNTSGVTDFLELLTASGAGVFRPVPWSTSCELILRQTHLNAVPGEEFIYSAGGFLVLCMILERVEGRPMEDVLEDRLFRPLGMGRSALVRDDLPIVPDVAWPYLEPAPGSYLRGGWGIEANCEGQIISTLDDMAAWMRELGDPRVLGRDIVDAMTTPLVYANGATGKYGLGLYVETFRGVPVFGHGGRMPGLKAEVAHYPRSGHSVVVLTNLHSVDPYAVGREVAACWVPDLEPVAPALVPAGLAGRYIEPDTLDVVEIVETAGGGAHLANSSGPVALRPGGGEAWEPAYSVLDQRLRLVEGGLEVRSCGVARVFRRAPEPPPWTPGDFVGDFRSEEIGATYHIRARPEGGLALRMQGELGYFDTVLDCLAADLFRALPADPRTAWNQPLLRFRRDAAGRVTGLLYSTDRTRRMPFERIGQGGQTIARSQLP